MRHHSSSAVVIVAILLCVGSGATALSRRSQTTVTPPSQSLMAQLWVDPGPTPRDLFLGVGGQEYAPSREVVYTLKAKNTSGFSESYDVVGPDGLEWSAKIGPEAQTEVVLSRVLWGLGYHQPPVYYLSSWTLTGGGADAHQEPEARFRPKLAELTREKEAWSWAGNPFSGTPQLKGLLVIMLMLNSTDLKDSNNAIYTTREPWDGASRWFVVRDIGAALGETGKFFPLRNWLEGFEKQGFITKIDANVDMVGVNKAGGVEFDYDGRHQDLLKMITPADVRWAAERMKTLSDEQWRDAFRAANFSDPLINRYLARIRLKIEDGLALRARSGDKREDAR